MFNDRPMPFYLSHPLTYEPENKELEEREWGIMRSWYTKDLLKAQEAVEKMMNALDYEGSWIYDEYPDQNRMERAQLQVQEELEKREGIQLEAEGRNRRRIEDALRLLWYQELFRRRCRRKRCRGHF